MMIEQQIQQAALAAVKALYQQEVPEKMVQLQKTRSEFEGNLTLVVFPFVKMARKSPEQTGQEIGEYLVANCPAVSKYNVVKGFLNLSIADAAWLQLLQDIDADAHYGEKHADDGQLDRHEAEDDVAPDQSRQQRQKDRPHDFLDGVSASDVRRGGKFEKFVFHIY